MRVLHVTVGNLYGGVETFLVTLARCRQVCPEMSPEFAVCYPGRLRDELAATGVPVHDLGPTRVSRPWSVLHARKRLRSVILAGRYDAVVCQMAWVLGLFADVARRVGMLAAHVHGAPVYGWVDRLAAYRKPELIIAPSRYTLDLWRPLFPGVPGRVLNNPLPPQVTEAAELTPAERVAVRAALGTSPDEVVILHASRMEPGKGPDLTLRAVAGLRDVPRWRLWLAGGAQRDQEQKLVRHLHQLACDLGIADRVEFLGQRSDVPNLMRSADIYCQGNRGPEGFSLSFLEASYCRLPVVTADLGGAREMVDAGTGFLVPTGEDAAALTAALRKLVTDSRLREEMGRRARDKAVRLCDPRQQLARLAGWLANRTATAVPDDDSNVVSRGG